MTLMSEKNNKFDSKKLVDFLFNNAMFIIIALVIVYVAIKRPASWALLQSLT